MKLPILFAAAIVMLVGANCSNNKPAETALSTDSLLLLRDDSLQRKVVAPTADSIETVIAPSEGTLITEDGKQVYESPNQYSFVSDPYDFALDSETIEALLGKNAKTKREDFPAGDDYSAFSYFTVTYEDSEMRFYDYPGKHFAHITTPLLPLKRGIRIGMKKDAFVDAMVMADEAREAEIIRLIGEYGQMQFSFKADTLSLIYAHYEEGD